MRRLLLSQECGLFSEAKISALMTSAMGSAGFVESSSRSESASSFWSIFPASCSYLSMLTSRSCAFARSSMAEYCSNATT